MTYLVNKLSDETVRELAAVLKDCAEEPVNVRFGDVECCPHFVTPIAALIDRYRTEGHDINIETPSHSAVDRALHDRALQSPFGIVWRFDDEDGLLALFDATQNAVLKLPSIGSGFKIAFGWCLSEIMDNVLQHSQEDTREKAIGYMMIQYVESERLLKCCVFDLGIGLLNSFKGSRFSPANAIEAVQIAVRPNVTSGNGQGNGLYGLREIVKQSSDGRLEIKSSGARYVLEKGQEIAGEVATLPGFSGITSVDFQVRFTNSYSLDSVFPDKTSSCDLWLENHEVGSDAVRVKVLEVVGGTISRDLGRDMRHAVENIIDTEHKRVILDFAGVEMCSSAFVDELIGKLLVRFQFVQFSRLIGFENLQGITVLLIDNSIRQRLSEEKSGVIIADSVGNSDFGPTGPAAMIPDSDALSSPELIISGHETENVESK